jgi:hypothetical protein
VLYLLARVCVIADVVAIPFQIVFWCRWRRRPLPKPPVLDLDNVRSRAHPWTTEQRQAIAHAQWLIKLAIRRGIWLIGLPLVLWILTLAVQSFRFSRVRPADPHLLRSTADWFVLILSAYAIWATAYASRFWAVIFLVNLDKTLADLTAAAEAGNLAWIDARRIAARRLARVAGGGALRAVKMATYGRDATRSGKQLNEEFKLAAQRVGAGGPADLREAAIQIHDLMVGWMSGQWFTDQLASRPEAWWRRYVSLLVPRSRYLGLSAVGLVGFLLAIESRVTAIQIGCGSVAFLVFLIGGLLAVDAPRTVILLGQIQRLRSTPPIDQRDVSSPIDV